MSLHARRKTYSSTFRSDWVVPDGPKSDEGDSARLDSLVAPGNGDSAAGIPSRVSGEADSKAPGEFVKREGFSSKTEPCPPKPRLTANHERLKPRYSTFHANDWTVPGPPSERWAAPTTSEPVDVASDATDHMDNEERAQHRATHRRWFHKRSHRQDSTNMPDPTKLNGSITRPSSAGSGYDAPPKPPSFAPTYSPA